ncbi:MAG TPA: L7Ae/L30e/S12e/Gadd45 family ribosomal protein [Gemmatimonadaceae bacterium]|nr:L7Ae/L30e/S12e/Gadd45 family ribosomal protein [Gemmatimonadaceae bacterium]
MNEAVTQRMLRMVGLGVRSRGAVVGVEQVREAAKRGKLALVVVASDASQHSLSKVVPLLVARRVRVVHAPSSSDLGRAVGRDQTAAVGIVDRQLAQGIRELMDSVPDGARERQV